MLSCLARYGRARLFTLLFAGLACVIAAMVVAIALTDETHFSASSDGAAGATSAARNDVTAGGDRRR